MNHSSPTDPLPWHQESWNRVLRQYRNEKLPHAFLISAEADTGKFHFASTLAYFLLCRQRTQSATSACGECAICLLNRAGNNPDLLVIRPEDGSKLIKVEQIRELKKFLETSSHSFGKRIIVMDTAESLGTSSANALLKGLEEPPADVLFLLLTDRPKAVLATITSRCQVITLPRPREQETLAWLYQELGADADELDLLLEFAQGRPLAAIQMHSEGAGKSFEDIGETLMQLIAGKVAPVMIAARFAKMQTGDVLRILGFWLSGLCKYQLTGEVVFLKGRLLKEAADLLFQDVGRDRSNVHEFFSLYNAVAEAQNQLTSSSNPNVQLMLEDIFLRVHQMIRHRRS